MPGIFISYRREDTAGHAGRIFDRLREKFGRDNVFMDVAGIEPGVDFVEAIDQAVGACDVLLVIIGKKWPTCTDASGKRRLDDPKDFIRLETATALRRDIRVIPVLVQDAAMPGEGDLPDELKKLARRQATEISDTHWDTDTGQLIETLAKVLHEEPRPAQTGAGEPAHAPVSAGKEPEFPAPLPSGSGRNKLIWIISAIMAVALTMGGLLYFLPSNRGADGMAAVPRLEGQPLEKAHLLLERAGLKAARAVRKESGEVPEGTVIEQAPEAGAKLARGETVELVVAISPSEPVMVSVPDVTGREVKKAIAMLKDAGLNVVRRMEEVTPNVEPGTVLKQSLKPGSQVRPDEAITLVFAAAPSGGETAGEIVLPDFTGSPLQKVEDYLKERGLVLGPVHERASSEHPAGTVIGQRPPPKTLMEKGEKVILLVAAPPGEPAALPAPEQMWPEDGRSFNNFPRTMALRWKPVPGAASYGVELDCLNCCEPGKWCSDLGKPWKVAHKIPAANSPGYKFVFVGAQPGRWRVWAAGKDGQEGEKSPWRSFRFTK